MTRYDSIQQGSVVSGDFTSIAIARQRRKAEEDERRDDLYYPADDFAEFAPQDVALAGDADDPYSKGDA